MIFETAAVIATLTGIGGYKLRAIRGPNVSRHRHDWEVVEKIPVEGTTIDDAIKASKASQYAVSIASIMEYVEPAGLIVHYRCMCGAEKVERV